MEDTGRAARYPHVTCKLTQCCNDLWNPPRHPGANSDCQGHGSAPRRKCEINERI